MEWTLENIKQKLLDLLHRFGIWHITTCLILFSLSWGSGTLKIISSCKEAGLPDPEIIEQDGGILVTLFRNRFSKEQLQKLGLNERQVKAIMYVVELRSITNSKYQEINSVGKTVATEELQELIGKELLKQAGSKGRGSKYELKD